MCYNNILSLFCEVVCWFCSLFWLGVILVLVILEEINICKFLIDFVEGLFVNIELYFGCGFSGVFELFVKICFFDC